MSVSVKSAAFDNVPEPDDHWFDDPGIVSQSSALIQNHDGSLTVGVAMIADGQVILEIEELRAALAELEQSAAFHIAMGHMGA